MVEGGVSYIADYNYITAVDSNGSELWTSSVAANGPSLAIKGDYVLALDNGLKGHDIVSGEEQFMISLPEGISGYSYQYNAPVVGSDNYVIGVQGSTLISFDISSNSVAWHTEINSFKSAKASVCCIRPCVFSPV